MYIAPMPEVRFESPQEEADLKIEFARMMIRSPDPKTWMIEARTFFGEHRQSMVAYAVNNWPNDEAVLAERARILADGEQAEELLMSEAGFKATLFAHAMQISDADSRTKAFELYAKVCGYIGGAKVNVNVDNSSTVTENRVFVMPRELEMDEWTKVAQAQQARLIADA